MKEKIQELITGYENKIEVLNTHIASYPVTDEKWVECDRLIACKRTYELVINDLKQLLIK